MTDIPPMHSVIPYSCQAHALARQDAKEKALSEWYGNKPHALVTDPCEDGKCSIIIQETSTK